MFDVPDGEIIQADFDLIDIFAGQARETFDDGELDNLAESIKQTGGPLQAGVAWYDEGRGRLILICGERRMRASKRAGLTSMAVKVIRGKRTHDELLEMNLSENIQRSNLNPVERGKAFRRMMQLAGLNARQVAARLKVSDAMVSRDLAILDLSPELQQQVVSGVLPSSVAATLARLDDDESRRFLANQFGTGNLSREEMTAKVNQLLDKPTRSKPDRLACKLDGLSFSISSGTPMTFDGLLKAIESLRKTVKALHDGGEKDLAALARSLKTF